MKRNNLCNVMHCTSGFVHCSLEFLDDFKTPPTHLSFSHSPIFIEYYVLSQSFTEIILLKHLNSHIFTDMQTESHSRE